MESIGEKLRTTRSQKGYSLEQVARDTHIAKRFIEALESEDFDVFPGEPYLLGFLRTYSEFLDLDSQEMVTLYKNLKIQEQPAPIDELIVKKSPRPFVIAGLAALILAGLAVGGYYLVRAGVFSGRNGQGATEQAAEEEQSREDEEANAAGREFVLQEQILEQRFAEGDVVRVPVEENEYPISVSEVGDGAVNVTTIAGSTQLEPNNEQMLDVDQDGRGDIRVLVREINNGDSPPTLVMRLDRVVQSPVASGGVAEGQTTTANTEPIGETDVPERQRSARVISEFDERDEFTVEIEFRGYSWFRYEVDGDQREEQYLQEGDTFRTTAQEEFRLWLSNGGVASLQVDGRPVDLGDPGEVVTALISWGTAEDGERPRLELVPVY
ncbi:MAG: helix-turn-helix domain-containing protein [Spirochaetaceae bacterium]